MGFSRAAEVVRPYARIVLRACREGFDIIFGGGKPPPYEKLQQVSSCKGSGKCYLVGIFKVASNGNTVSQTGHLNPHRL